MFAGLLMMGTLIEWLVWAAICVVVLLGSLLRVGEAMHHAIFWLWPHPSQGHLTHPRIVTFFLAGALIGAALAIPVSVNAQGWWWGSPINPGFDRNTFIQVTGTAIRVNIISRGGPSTLQLETSGETFTVMLCPGWYLAELHADIQNGDPIVVEGSKIMDPRGNLHLVAARVTNQRNGTVLELRDEAGHPRWMGHGSPNRPGL
jgi:hypothetical protein